MHSLIYARRQLQALVRQRTSGEHRRPTHLGGGRFEFHGNFELRALPPGDVPSLSPSAGMPAAEMMSHAPLVLSAQGVDVVIEKAPEH